MKRNFLLVAPAVLFCCSLASAASSSPPSDVTLMTADQFMWHEHFFDIKSTNAELTQSQCNEILDQYEGKIVSIADVRKRPNHKEFWYKFGHDKAVGLINHSADVQVKGQTQKTTMSSSLFFDYKTTSLIFGVATIGDYCSAKVIVIPSKADVTKGS